jgi:NADH-quinone oxidoreductase subunit G
MPGLLPGGRRTDDPGPLGDAWNRVPETPGRNTRAILEGARDGDIKALVLIGADPVTDFEDPRLADRALAAVPTVISLDLLPTASNRYADVLLPACAPQERVGSFTTWEGRRQPFGQVVPPQGNCLEDWDILRQLARVMGTDLGWETAMDVRREAAPLMQSSASSLADIALGTMSEPASADDDAQFDVQRVKSLIGNGTMLLGAQELLASANDPVVLVSPNDAKRLELSDGQLVDVEGADARVRLPVGISATVAQGAVVLYTGTTVLSPQALSGGSPGSNQPLRVSIAATQAVTA